jgi:hypothetical protein
MNWHLVTYADKNFEDQQKFLHQTHKDGFIHHPYSRENLEKTDFYQENKQILDESIGAGWWIWKPYFILDVLKSSNDGDFIIYCDCGDMFSPGLKSYIERTMTFEDQCLLLVGNNLNGNYTKRDCFIKMNCDEEDYYNSNQLEVGFMVWKVCEESINTVSEWLNYCKDTQIINNDPSLLGEELDGFVAHRNDQSVLTNIAIRDGLSVGGLEYRNYVECDYDYWYERGGSNNFGREIESFLRSIKNA